MPWNGHWRFDCSGGIILLEGDRVWAQRTGAERQEVPLTELPRAGQAYLLHEFVAAITARAVPATTCADNLKSLQIVFDAIGAFQRHPR